MAERINLSASHLSQVEQDKSMPSLVTLTRIAEVLAVNPRDLLDSGKSLIHITRADRLEAREPFQNLELTDRTGDAALEVHRLTLQPRTPDLEFGPYPGEVLGFVVAGMVAVVIEAEQVELAAGDSIHYDGNQVYRLRCQSDEPCCVIWCNSPPRVNPPLKVEVAGAGASSAPAANRPIGIKEVKNIEETESY